MSGVSFTPQSIQDDDNSRTLRAKTRNNLDAISIALGNIQSATDRSIRTVKDSVVKPAIRGGFNVNDIRYYGTLAQVINAVPTGNAATVFVTNVQAIQTNTVVPSNISLVMFKGGSFVIAGGATLTMNGSVDTEGNSLTDLFSGAGSYVFGKAARLTGAGTPEGVVAAPVGSEFLRTDGGSGSTAYIKESGTGNTGWVAIIGSGSLPTTTPNWFKYTIGYAAFSIADVANDVALFTLPAKSFIHAVFLKHSTAFAGTAITAITLSVGITGDLTKFLAPFDVLSAVTGTNFTANNMLDMESYAISTSVRVAATSDGGYLDALTQGSAEIQFLLSVLA